MLISSCINQALNLQNVRGSKDYEWRVVEKDATEKKPLSFINNPMYFVAKITSFELKSSLNTLAFENVCR